MSATDFRNEFIALALRHRALRFGSFTLKSGRNSPYFFNAGEFSTGGALAALGRCYAAAIAAEGVGFDMLFGPAYKGIPLAVATAVAINNDSGRDVPCAFNRKEAKTHGEGGVLMGAPLAGRVLVIDDVITAGTAVRARPGSRRARLGNGLRGHGTRARAPRAGLQHRAPRRHRAFSRGLGWPRRTPAGDARLPSAVGSRRRLSGRAPPQLLDSLQQHHRATRIA